VTEAPVFGHAEIVVRPRPLPSDVSTTVKARAANAPAKIAAQLTAEVDASSVVVGGTTTVLAGNAVMVSARSMQAG